MKTRENRWRRLSGAMGWVGDGVLVRQASCACPSLTLDVRRWRWSGSRRHGARRSTGGYYCEEDDDEELLGSKGRRGMTGRWRGIWRRIVGGRPAPPSYDEESYAQNFEDDGAAWVEPEFLPRSFSAVYANPSGFPARFAR